MFRIQNIEESCEDGNAPKIFKSNICHDNKCHHMAVCMKGIDSVANFISLFEDMKRIFLYKLR
jgi:hypothetical protein